MTRAERPFAPRRLVHRGSVSAVGFVLDDAIVGSRERSLRVLARWSPGASLRRLGGGRWWLRLPSPVRVRVDEAPGTPLVNDAGLACGAPGLAAAARRLGAVDGAAVLVRAGALEVLPPGAGEAVDPSRWLDLATFARSEVRGVGVAAVGPTLSLPIASADVRAVLGPRVPPATAEAKQVARELADQVAGRTRPPLAGASDGPSPLVRWLAGMFRMLSSALTSAMLRPGGIGGSAARAAGSAAGGASEKKRGLVVRPVDPSGPGWMARTAQRLNDLAARMLLSSRLAPLVGQKQAAYLDRMMQMFEQGKLDDALRHAIPLGGSGEESGLLTLGVPQPRSALELSTGASGGGTSVLPYAGLFEELKKLYQAAFEKLDAEGRVEEAAFVLAELLHETEKAVAYLERNGQFQLAAELAEGRKLDPGLVVRQWFIAGDMRRAVLLARRHQAFAAAVVRLEETHVDQAHALRLLWAETLASAGDFLTAASVAEPLPETRALRLAWLARVVASGGAPALTALVRRLALDPDTFDDAVRHVTPLLGDTAPEASADRLVLANALLASPTVGAGERAIARPLMRAVLVDSNAGPEPALLGRLRETFADGPLRVDWPTPPSGATASSSDPLAVRETAPGTVSVRDAALLPGGRWLVALGEAGVMLLSRDGRRTHHFDQPADHLVVSHHGDRALALIARGPVTRLARLDIAGRREQPWSEAPLACWSPSFDGASWVVALADGSLTEIDALADGWSSLWRMRDLGGTIEACGPLSLGGESIGVLVADAVSGMRSLWQLASDTRTLRRRDELSPVPPMTIGPRPQLALGPTGVLVWEPDPTPPVYGVAGTPGEAILLRPGQPPRPLETTLTHSDVAQLCPLPHGFLRASGGLAEIHATTSDTPRLVARLTLDDASRIVAHATPHGVAIADDRGRLLALRWDTARDTPTWLRTVRI